MKQDIIDILMKRMRENLPDIRKIAGWSGDALGSMLGLSRQSISKLETGLSVITVSQYIAIRHLLDAWVVRHPENKTLPSIMSLLLDHYEIAGADYAHLRRITKTVAAAASAGADQGMIDELSALLLKEWEKQAAVTVRDSNVISVAQTDGGQSVDWTEVILSSMHKSSRRGNVTAKNRIGESIPQYLAAFQNGETVSEEQAADLKKLIDS